MLTDSDTCRLTLPGLWLSMTAPPAGQSRLTLVWGKAATRNMLTQSATSVALDDSMTPAEQSGRSSIGVIAAMMSACHAHLVLHDSIACRAGQHSFDLSDSSAQTYVSLCQRQLWQRGSQRARVAARLLLDQLHVPRRSVSTRHEAYPWSSSKHTQAACLHVVQDHHKSFSWQTDTSCCNRTHSECLWHGGTVGRARQHDSVLIKGRGAASCAKTKHFHQA